MPLVRARLDELELPLVEPFETSFGVEKRRRVLFVTVEESGGEEGIGECVAGREPLYSEESVDTARWMIARHLLPAVVRSGSLDPGQATASFGRWRGHRMAKAAVEMALWDLSARTRGSSLARRLGARRRRVPVGVSVGIQPSAAILVRRVGKYLEDGYRRVKLKVRPGWDDEPVREVRRAFPDLELWADANQAYSLRDLPRILSWAHRWSVAQVEQPFPARSLEAHARLRARGRFRVCLDESIVDRPSLEDAIARDALSSLNVKPGRVGGLGPGIDLARRAHAAGIAVWVGGMLETGIGRAHAVALAARSEFTLSADLSASDRYFDPDLVDPPFRLLPDSTLEVPTGRGVGVTVVPARWRAYRRRSRLLRF
jgi:O-succinylbenzoate synthase